MFDIYTILLAVWFAIIALIITEIFVQVPYPRIRILLPLVCGVLLGLFIIILNPGLESGYRGQIDYPGPFLFPVLIPLFIVVPLIHFEKKDGIFGEYTGFSGGVISAFLFLTLYQSGIFYGIFQECIASIFLFGSALVIFWFIFFIISRARPLLSGSRDERQVKNDHEPATQNPRVDLRSIGTLAICLLLFLSPMWVIDFVTNNDRSTMGQLYLYRANTSEVPEGTVTHMTVEKMQEFPDLQSLMKKPPVQEYGDSVHPEKKDENTSGFGMVRISCKTESRMHNAGLFKGLYTSSYFEYDGNLYKVEILHYAGEECAEVSFFS
jgi:hypothetical protein